MSTPENSLVFLRHAKSAYPPGVADIDRPLAPRGRRQAPLAGEWIREKVGAFDLILCSPAQRTRETLELAELSGSVQFVDELFSMDHLDYIGILRQFGGTAQKLAVVGHQPAIAATALSLASNRDSKAAKAIEHKYPTASVAFLKGKEAWANLESGHMDLKAFFVPPHGKPDSKHR